MRRDSIEIPGVTRFVGRGPGPSVVVLGGIHGNEYCGVRALEEIESFLLSGQLKVIRGSLTLIRGNLDALCLNKRFITYDLNRLFKDTTGLNLCFELVRAEQLKPLLIAADYVVDLHSTSQPSPPFILCEEPDKDFATCANIPWVVLGWTALDSALTGDTCSWAGRHGVKSFTLECGQHDDPNASVVALSATIRVLISLGMIQSSAQFFDSINPTVLRLYHAQLLRDPGFTYSRKYQGLDAVRAGECIGTDKEGVHMASLSGHIVFPADPGSLPLNTELYLLAHK